MGAIRKCLKFCKNSEGRSLCDLSDDEIKDLVITKNMSYEEIAGMFGTQSGSVGGYLRRRGIQKPEGLAKRHKAETLKKDNSFLCLTPERIKELYLNQNMSVKELATMFGTSVSAVATRLSRMGIHKPVYLCSAIQEKTNMERYGVKSTAQIPEIKAKQEQTCKKHYGVTNALMSSDIRERAFQTMERKYGTRNVLSNPEIAAKQKATLLKHFGVDNSMKASATRAKARKTVLQNYGVSNPMQNPLVRKRQVATLIERYGVHNSQQMPQSKIKGDITRGIPPQTAVLLQDRGKMTAYIKECCANTPDKPTLMEISQKLGCNYITLQQKCKDWDLDGFVKLRSTRSQQEKELVSMLEEWGVRVLPNKTGLIKQNPELEIDAYLPDYKMGIEFNGDFWHSEVHKTNDYTQKKSLWALENGIFIYHIWLSEWEDSRKRRIIISMLRSLVGLTKNRIYGRKTTIDDKISAQEANSFLDINHLQGRDAPSVRLGLRDENGNLVSLMTFAKPRFNKNYRWELSRFCSSCDTEVIGGAAKLFSYFIKHYSGSIISYSNISKTKGTIYPKLGFVLDHTSRPNYFWENMTTGDIKTRYQCQVKREVEEMHNKGYVRVFDAGNRVWVYK